MSQEGAGAKGMDQSARTALYNRALCHHYAGRTAEAKARTLLPAFPPTILSDLQSLELFLAG